MAQNNHVSLGLKNYQYPDKFGEWLGYQVVQMDRDKHVAELELTLREEHLSPAKRVHGGVISAFFDCALGATVFTTLGENDYCSTVELKVNYFYPINLGDRLRVRGQVMFRGKKLCVVQALMYRNDEPTLVAMCTGTLNVVTPHSGQVEALVARK
jgi:uncharacterized protein (TIGR00369 family)